MRPNSLYLILCGLMILFSCQDYEEIVIEEVALNSVKDGSYIGECNETLVKVRVKVDIRNHKIENIEILQHQCGKGKKANKIVQDVMKQQSLQVDAISGATYSSKVLLKAIERALTESNSDKQI